MFKELFPQNSKLTGDLKPGIYLIEKLDDYNFLIHREIQESEEVYLIGTEKFEYKGKTYLFGVANCPTEEEAIIAIQSYWSAINGLNNLKQFVK